jgi:hypothetical protein
MNYEILYPGLFYFKNAIENPEKIIDIVERYESPALSEWVEWSNKNPSSDEQAKSTAKPYGYGKSLYGGLAFDPNWDNLDEKAEVQYLIESISNAISKCSDIYSKELGLDPSNERNTVQEFVVGKYLPGKGRGPHIDCTYDDLEHSYVVYYNDDYEGGELVFPEIDIKIKPEAGSIVMFKSIEKQFIHHALITSESSSYKYITPHFWRMGASQGYKTPQYN